jgi:16S rRNA (cytidine1402-2'-O)-methyltransferase
VLREADLVACEDTRRTAQLLAAHGIAARTTSYFEHTERWKGDRLVEELLNGRTIALVSDAGTPGISDPGFRLVRDARAAGVPVVPVPGPSAAVAALSVSGLPSDRFVFVGFLPPRAGARRKAVARLAGYRETLVLYEAPTRLVDALADLRAGLGDREAFLCREATKLHEEYRRGTLGDLAAEMAARPGIRGEVVLVVAGAAEPVPADEDALGLYSRLVAEGRTRREAVKEVARRLGRPAREVYRDALASDSAQGSPRVRPILDNKTPPVQDSPIADPRRKS